MQQRGAVLAEYLSYRTDVYSYSASVKFVVAML